MNKEHIEAMKVERGDKGCKKIKSKKSLNGNPRNRKRQGGDAVSEIHLNTSREKKIGEKSMPVQPNGKK